MIFGFAYKKKKENGEILMIFVITKNPLNYASPTYQSKMPWQSYFLLESFFYNSTLSFGKDGN